MSVQWGLSMWVGYILRQICYPWMAIPGWPSLNGYVSKCTWLWQTDLKENIYVGNYSSLTSWMCWAHLFSPLCYPVLGVVAIELHHICFLVDRCAVKRMLHNNQSFQYALTRQAVSPCCECLNNLLEFMSMDTELCSSHLRQWLFTCFDFPQPVSSA